MGMGANLAFGNDTLGTDTDDPFRPVTLPDDTEVRFSRLTVILGFNFFSF